MHPSELTVDIVRKELETLINQYPDETGSVDQIKHYADTDEEYNDPVCAYYKDQSGNAITPGLYGGVEVAPSDVVLATPVCIVGRWIEAFHPELKNDEVIRNILVKNATIRSLDYDGISPFKPEVQRMLMIAQDTQDRGGNTWSSIDLDRHPDDYV